jgi:hypothetical protein
MALFPQDNLRPPLAPGKQGQLIPKGSRWNKQGGLFPGYFRAQGFQGIYGGVLPIPIIPHRRAGHGLPHPFGWSSNRIASYIDHPPPPAIFIIQIITFFCNQSRAREQGTADRERPARFFSPFCYLLWSIHPKRPMGISKNRLFSEVPLRFLALGPQNTHF